MKFGFNRHNGFRGEVENVDWVKHSACRLSHYIYIISNTFITYAIFFLN